MWRLLFAGRRQPLVEVAGALRGSGCSLECTREASGESPDPSGELPDRVGQLRQHVGDFLDRLGDFGDHGDHIRDKAGELAERRNAVDDPRRASFLRKKGRPGQQNLVFSLLGPASPMVRVGPTRPSCPPPTKP